MTALTPTPLSERLLGGVSGKWLARIVVTEPGIVAGLASVEPVARPLLHDGDPIRPGAALAELTGTPAELAGAEDHLLGELGVACGVATRAAAIARAAPAGLRVVCGGWKKLPPAMKDAVRAGLAAAGVGPRLVEGPFVYVGKNAVRLLGGVEEAARAAVALDAGPAAVQVTTPAEARAAAAAGAAIVMVDSGRIADLAAARGELERAGLLRSVTLAFGGGARAEGLATIAASGAAIVDVGRAILERPLLDLRFEVLGRA